MAQVQTIAIRGAKAAPPASTAIPLAIAAAIIPTALRLALSDVVTGAPFPAYFPFVLGAAIYLGWRYAMVTTVLSALAANFFFLGRPDAFSGSVGDVTGTVLFLASATAIIGTIDATRPVRAAVEARAAAADNRPLPRGYGLAIGGVLSMGLWAGLIWGAFRLFA